MVIIRPVAIFPIKERGGTSQLRVQRPNLNRHYSRGGILATAIVKSGHRIEIECQRVGTAAHLSRAYLNGCHEQSESENVLATFFHTAKIGFFVIDIG